MSEFAASALACVRGERVVFSGLEFTARSGDMLALTGPNGSGKSSLLRVLAGLLRPENGTMTWDGTAVTDEPEAHRARLHYVGHGNAVKPVLTVAENLEFTARLRGTTVSRSTLDAALSAFAIGHLADLPVQYLSAGQRRRLALARLLASPAPLWLLDEPETSLDAESTRALEAIVAHHCHEGGIAIVATHDAKAGSARSLDVAAFAHARGVVFAGNDADTR
jgi:heme exporter protein A